MVKDLRETKPHHSSIFLIILGNVIPVIGVLFFGWNLAQVVVLYWIENLIIGFWNIPRILSAGKSKMSERVAMALFFTVHYGIFCMVHGMFIITMVSITLDSEISISGLGNISDFVSQGVGLGAAMMFLSIGWDFYQGYLRNGDCKKWKVSHAMFHPYGHIIVIHLAIIVTGIITFVLGTPMALLILLVVGKTILEYFTKSGRYNFSKVATKRHRSQNLRNSAGREL